MLRPSTLISDITLSKKWLKMGKLQLNIYQPTKTQQIYSPNCSQRPNSAVTLNCWDLRMLMWPDRLKGLCNSRGVLKIFEWDLSNYYTFIKLFFPFWDYIPYPDADYFGGWKSYDISSSLTWSWDIYFLVCHNIFIHPGKHLCPAHYQPPLGEITVILISLTHYSIYRQCPIYLMLTYMLCPILIHPFPLPPALKWVCIFRDCSIN